MVFNNQAFKDTNISKIKNIKENIDIISCELDGCTLERIQLISGFENLIDASMSTIKNSKLKKLKLLYGEGFKECSVSDCEFDDVYINHLNMEKCSFDRIKINRVVISGLHSTETKFVDLKGTNIDFSVVKFINPLFSGMEINHFVYANNCILGGTFENINIENGYVSENNIDKTEFKNVVWKKTTFRKNSFQDIDFTSTEFVECEFDRCEFHNCFFTEEQKKQIGLEN